MSATEETGLSMNGFRAILKRQLQHTSHEPWPKASSFLQHAKNDPNAFNAIDLRVSIDRTWEKESCWQEQTTGRRVELRHAFTDSPKLLFESFEVQSSFGHGTRKKLENYIIKSKHIHVRSRLAFYT